MPDCENSGASDAVAELGRTLSHLGMTPGERDAFMRAWSENLFGAGATREDEQEAGNVAPPQALRPARDSLLYWWPQADADQTVPLVFDPPASAVHRALLIRVDLTSTTQASTDPALLSGSSTTRETESIPFGVSDRPGPPLIDLHTEDVVVRSGGLSEEVVRRVVHHHINELRFCYEQALLSQPRASLSHAQIAGTLEMRLLIRPTGVVTVARRSGGTLSNAAVTSCAEGAMRRWDFPSSSDRATRARVRWSFASHSPPPR